MNDYVDVSDFVAEHDRREACQAVLRDDVCTDDDEIIGTDDDTNSDD